MKNEKVSFLEKFTTSSFYLSWIHPVVNIFTHVKPESTHGVSIKQVAQITADHRVSEVIRSEDGTPQIIVIE